MVVPGGWPGPGRAGFRALAENSMGQPAWNPIARPRTGHAGILEALSDSADPVRILFFCEISKNLPRKQFIDLVVPRNRL